MKTVYQAYKEAREGINIKKNEKIILESKNIDYCYEFARDVPGANIKAFEEVILEIKDPYWCYSFAKYLKGSNKEELFKVILESGNKFWINRFLEDVEFNKEKFANYILFI